MIKNNRINSLENNINIKLLIPENIIYNISYKTGFLHFIYIELKNKLDII